MQGQCDANVNTWGNEGAQVGPMLQNFVGPMLVALVGFVTEQKSNVVPLRSHKKVIRSAVAWFLASLKTNSQTKQMPIMKLKSYIVSTEVVN